MARAGRNLARRSVPGDLPRTVPRATQRLAYFLPKCQWNRLRTAGLDSINMTLGWWNGIHDGLRSRCRKACRFKSCPEHQIVRVPERAIWGAGRALIAARV